MAGYVDWEGGWRAALIRLNARGDTLWTRVYTPGTRANEVACTPDGGFIWVGHGIDYWGESDLWVMKTDSLGWYQWAWTWGQGPDWAEARSVSVLPDGSCLVAGLQAIEDSASCPSDGFLAKIDAMGDPLWVRKYGRGELDEFASLATTNEGGCVAAGSSRLAAEARPNIWLVRVDNVGDTVWTGIYGGESGANAESIVSTPRGDYVIGGASYGSRGRGLVMDVDDTGQFVWQCTPFDWTGEECQIHSVVGLGGGGWAVAGYALRRVPSGWIVTAVAARLSDCGDTVWTCRVGAGESEYDGSEVVRLCESPDHGLLVVGSVWMEDTWYCGAYLTKFRGSGTDAGDPLPPVPTGWSLTCYPNPFNPSATVAFDLPQAGSVRVVVYDILGRLTTVLADGRLTAGEHRLSLDGSGWASGVYFVRLEAAAAVRTQKIILLR